jgi:SulP family sulfate permease
MGRRAFWSADILAGLSVALVLIPQGMAYAELAGLPAHRGLYAGALPLLIGALFASSPYLQTGPVALTSLLTFGALSSISTPGSDEYVGLAALLALVVGIVRVAIGLIGAGPVSYLMSRPVLRGFTAGAAVLIASSQLPSVLGSDVAGSVLARAGTALASPSSWNLTALALGAGTVVLVLGGRKVHTMFPGVLVAVIGGVVYSSVSGFDGAVVGEIPSALFPPVTVALPWSDIGVLVVSGIIIALVGFAEAASVAQLYAEREKQRWDPNREFISQGAANVAAAFSGGFPVGGSFSRSSLNYVAGAKSRLSGAITGAAVLIALPFAFVLAPLPKAILGAIVIAAVLKLLNPLPLLELWRMSIGQAVVGTTTFVLTLVLAPHIEYAVIAGIAMSVGVHIWREQYFDVEHESAGSVLTLRPVGVIWFGSAPMFRESLTEHLASHRDADQLVIELSRVGRIDITGALALRDVAASAETSGLATRFVSIPPNAARIMMSVCHTHMSDDTK